MRIPDVARPCRAAHAQAYGWPCTHARPFVGRTGGRAPAHGRALGPRLPVRPHTATCAPVCAAGHGSARGS